MQRKDRSYKDLKQKQKSAIADKTYKIYTKFQRTNKISKEGNHISAVEAFEFVHSGTHVGEEQIEDRDCGHRFYDYDGAWDDDRVVTSFNDHFGVFSIFGDGGLWL